MFVCPSVNSFQGLIDHLSSSLSTSLFYVLILKVHSCFYKCSTVRASFFRNMFILIRRVNRLLMGRNWYFSLWYLRHQRPTSHAKPIFLPACLSNPGELQTAEQTSSPKLLLTWLQSFPFLCLSICMSLFFLFLCLFFFCFRLRKPRDIHGTEANNVELKTKFFRPYPSNRAITICSEDRAAIIW